MKSNSNTFHRGLATLPAQNNLAPPEDGRRRSLSDPPLLSVPEPYQSIPAQELLKDNCGKSGWIRKEGGSFKTWRDRYIILHKGCLYYYQNSEATTTSGKFSLSGYRLSPAPERSNKYPWTFKLVHLQPEKRTYYFAAYSEREMNEWMDNITEEMEEFCGSPKQKICEITESGDGLEYCYPEVEPRFDPEELAALFGKPSPSLPRKPAAEPAMYCPPPEIEPRDVPKKSPLLPKTPAHSFPKGCNVSNIGAIRPHEGAATLRPGKPFPGSSPVFPLTTNLSPMVPSRLAKPAPSQPPPLTPPKPKPKPLPRPPPLEKRFTEPTFMKYQGTPAGGQDEAEITEDYLDIVPDTTPEDVVEEKKSTLSRGFPDGNSFRRYHSEETLSPSTVTLDMDKTTVNKLLEDRLGVYILRKSENAQSKRALSVWTGDRVRHYLIFYEGKTGYSLDPTEGVYFEDLEDLISHYHKNNLPKCNAKLLRPFKKKEKV